MSKWTFFAVVSSIQGHFNEIQALLPQIQGVFKEKTFFQGENHFQGIFKHLAVFQGVFQAHANNGIVHLATLDFVP